MSVTTEQTVNPQLAVVIPYYDGAQFIEQCLQAVLEGSVVPRHVYIVDNDPAGLSTSSSIFTDEHVIVIRTKPAIGFGHAVNVGVSAAIQNGHTLFLALNQDTRIDEFCISSMVQSHSRATKSTLVAAMIYTYESTELDPYFIKYILKDQTPYFEDLERNEVKATYPLTRIGAACVLFDQSIYLSVGLFDPLFYMYGEDDDLCVRIRKIGGELLLDTNANVHHFHALLTTDGKKKERIDSWFAISRILLRIRYTGLTRSGYVVRSVYYFLKTALGLHGRRMSSVIFLTRIPQILTHWRFLKSTNADQIRMRIVQHVIKDRL